MGGGTTVLKTSYRGRPGWTLIELIFILIIIGILASVAIGKLSTTRDDAKLSTAVHNMSVCIVDAGAYYIATGLDYSEAIHPIACDRKNRECYDIIYGIDGDFNVTTNTTRKTYCYDIENVGGHLAKDYDFGGSRIVR